jgi:hypothetical protein
MIQPDKNVFELFKNYLKTKNNIMNILISYNENDYLNAEAHLQNIGLIHIQEVVNDYLKLGVGTLYPAEFSRLFKQPIELIFDKITGGELAISGIKVDKKKAIEIIDKPNGYQIFLDKLSNTMSYLTTQSIAGLYRTVTVENLTTFFVLNESCEVKINDDIKAPLQNSFKKYATSIKAKKLYEFSRAVIDKYNELEICTVIAGRGDSIGGILNDLIETKYGKGIEIRESGILSYNNQ